MARADVNTRAGNLRLNERALYRAAARGHNEVVGLLLKFKADIRAKDYFS